MQASTQEQIKDMAGAAWRYMPVLRSNFRLSESELRVLLGDLPRATLNKGLKQHDVKLSKDQLGRVSLMLGIQKALLILFSGNPTRAFDWLDRPNKLPPFSGQTPKAFMLQGDYQQLYETRKLLDAMRG